MKYIIMLMAILFMVACTPNATVYEIIKEKEEIAMMHGVECGIDMCDCLQKGNTNCREMLNTCMSKYTDKKIPKKGDVAL